ncbi:MAG: molybdopterin-dependent oxidoreductase, partial [Halobacteria archaeon]|nr:molybdopterin-dependent oxidoreductase [Halobacteria archaeon]
LLDRADERSLDIEGIPGLVSDIDEFYEVDINSVNPSVNSDSWRLKITGEVENELTFTYDDITSLPQENRYMTLRCVGEHLNGHKMDNAVWTGTPIMGLIEQANPQGNYVMLRAADGYYEEFSFEALKTGFLAYGMNGEVLPRGHGFPVRALIPGHWGEINVKWLTEIEILEEEDMGYWEERGWHGTGPVNTVAKIWTVNRLDNGKFQVGGHAYAGTRGIQKVEVSVDGGETWNQAELSQPLEGEDVWRQWKYEWNPSKGQHTIIARATDGEGNLQPKKESQPFPSGPTGWVSKNIEV